jgi:hypothetical protein
LEPTIWTSFVDKIKILHKVRSGSANSQEQRTENDKREKGGGGGRMRFVSSKYSACCLDYRASVLR